MSLFIDPPMWWWHGRNWSHLISDESVDELHAFARQARLRYLSFGFDHYDVPEDLFDHVVDLGVTVIDPRQVVRTLRESGLRTSLGKQAKRWVRATPEERAAVWGSETEREVEIVNRAVDALGGDGHDVEILVRPSELAVAVAGPNQPADAAVASLRHLVETPVQVIVTPGPWGWAIEVVVPRDEPRAEHT